MRITIIMMSMARRCVIILGFGLLISACGAEPEQGAEKTPTQTVRVIIDLINPSAGDAVATVVKAGGGKVVRRYKALPYIAVEANGATLIKVLAMPKVAAVRPDRVQTLNEGDSK